MVEYASAQDVLALQGTVSDLSKKLDDLTELVKSVVVADTPQRAMSTTPPSPAPDQLLPSSLLGVPTISPAPPMASGSREQRRSSPPKFDGTDFFAWKMKFLQHCEHESNK